ncbi:Crp/Fnr family transcriptional regulator [Cohnella suwonensis]|uniref:Crp/Fnr family transcriptional regulator n=1 Tax=Cohnella suwonensis TaxID=696072 RepID=A0ABW0LZI0_9BACL
MAMIGLTDVQLRRLLESFPCFGEIPHEAWQTAELVAATPDTPHSIREGHLFRHAMFIVSGTIRVYRNGPTGKEITLYRVRGGQCCPLMMASVLGGVEYEASVSIEADTELLLVPAPEFNGWMAAYQPVGRFVYKQIVERFAKLADLLENVAYRPISVRIAAYLIASSSPNDTISVTHERLAVEIGTSREVVTRVLRDMASSGVVHIGRGRIAIADRDALRNIVDRFA